MLQFVVLNGWVRYKEYLVTSDNVCKEGEELDLNSYKVHVSLLVEVGTRSARRRQPQLVLFYCAHKYEPGFQNNAQNCDQLVLQEECSCR